MKRAGALLALALLGGCAPTAAAPPTPAATVVVTPAATSPAPTAIASPSPAAPARTPTPAERLTCAERVALPQIDNVVVARWSPDGTTLAVGWIGTLPSRRTPTGTEEELLFDAVDVRTGARRPLGTGSHTEWSGSGALLSYWSIDGEELRIVRGGHLQDAPEATMPESRWVGDTLVYFVRDEIRRWSAGTVTTVARLPAELTPRYPQDDVHFSGDGQRFTLTRYSRSGGAVRYLGTTATGRVERLDPPGVTHTEWGPTGHTLLVRYPDRLELRDDGGVRAAPLSRLGGPAHVWAADGTALLVGAVTPALPGGESLDTLAVWGGVQAAETARLPNLVGARAFSPSGEHFVGVSRTGLQTTRLEVYRCGGTATPAAPLTDAWRTAIASETRRLLRPATGTIVQGVFGNHTGVDLSTPLGSLIVAADDGVVGAIGWVPTGGERLCLQHAALMETCYFHIASSLVTTGQRVVRGQPIALIGLTGDTTGPHVHWEARIAGRVVDPLTR